MWRSGRRVDWLIAALVVGCCLAGSWAMLLAVRLPAPDEFNVARWELEHIPNKWLYLTGRLFDGRLSTQEEDERLARYLELTARGREAAGDTAASDGAQLQALTEVKAERQRLENDVEAIIEGRLTAVLEDAGLSSSLPLFPDARWVFPPVDVELDDPPGVLAISRRDRIEIVDRQALRPGLSPEAIIAKEQAVERDGELSALVERIAGAATYPSVVAPDSDYLDLVETIAHEWVHQYLYFKPLGVRVVENEELRTLNETVANIAGRDLAALVVARVPLPAGAVATPGPVSNINVGVVLRQLRLDVEELLGQGNIDEAERLMEQRRQELAARGVVYRRINQAFFAFRSVYADDPASIDPIGEQMQTLREREGSVGAFLRAAEGLTSAADLDELLARVP